jgi:hypothetical protein
MLHPVVWYTGDIVLMMEAASTSETSVILYETTRRNNPEDSHVYNRRRDNMKSRLFHGILLVWAIWLWQKAPLDLSVFPSLPGVAPS